MEKIKNTSIRKSEKITLMCNDSVYVCIDTAPVAVLPHRALLSEAAAQCKVGLKYFLQGQAFTGRLPGVFSWPGGSWSYRVVPGHTWRIDTYE